MHTKFRIRYHARKLALHLMGPAQLDSAHDPIKKLEREWEAHFGTKRQQPDRVNHYVPKRRFRPGVN